MRALRTPMADEPGQPAPAGLTARGPPTGTPTVDGPDTPKVPLRGNQTIRPTTITREDTCTVRTTPYPELAARRLPALAPRAALLTA